MSVFIYLICFARLLICCLLFAVVAGFCFCLFVFSHLFPFFFNFFPPLSFNSFFSSLSPLSPILNFLPFLPLLYFIILSSSLIFSCLYSLFSSPLSSSLFSSLLSSSFRIYFPRPYSLSNDYKSQCPIIPLSQRCEWDWVASAWLIHLFAGFCLWLAFNPDFPPPSVFFFSPFFLRLLFVLVSLLSIYFCMCVPDLSCFFRSLLYPSTCLYPRVIYWLDFVAH